MGKAKKFKEINANVLDWRTKQEEEKKLAKQAKALKGKEQKAIGSAYDKRNMDRWYESESN